MIFVLKNQITECSSQSVGLVIDMVLYTMCHIMQLQRSAHDGDMAEGLTAALTLQSLVRDMHGQGAQSVLTLKMTLIQ
jgi:hypothetical protein